MFEIIKNLKVESQTFIHDSAQVLSTKIGEGTKIWQFVVALPDAVIGSNCNINAHCFIENNVVIGNNVTIKCGVQIWDGLRLEDDVFIGPNVTFTNDIYPRSKVYPDKFIETWIKEGASIGANATIIAGVVVGSYAMVGAGSVVTKHIPPFTLWVGNPARQVGFITKKGVILDNELKDKHGKVHQLN